MPELPEVETVKRGLKKLIVGKAITAIDNDWQKSFPNDKTTVQSFALDARIIAIRRRAKVLLIDLDTKYSFMVHLKMTGQIVFVASRAGESNDQGPMLKEDRFGAGHPNNSLIGRLPDRSTRVTFTFSDGTHMFFNDQRKFGWVKLLPTDEVMHDPFFKKVGPEPLESEFTAEVLLQRIARRANTTIKAALLDQTVLAGVGNIYADESLWVAKVHPATRVKNVTESQMRLIHTSLIAVMNLSIEKGGSTDKNYVNAEGKPGSYIDFAKVFRREGLECERCGSVIEKSRVAGRGTHTCPVCQPASV